MLKKSLLNLGLLSFTFFAQFSYAEDKEVEFEVKGQKVLGTLTIPEKAEPVPAVLMLHGFTASRNESSSEFVPEGLFGKMAKALEEKGIASLRIDMRGSGKSEGSFSDITIESEIEDALSALNYLYNLDEIDKNRISVMGLSLGGIVSTATASRAPFDVRSVVLWNPGINPPAAFITMFGRKNVQRGTAIKPDEIHSVAFNGAELSMKGDFYRSLFRIVPAAELGQYKGAVFLAIGTADDIVWHQPTSAEALLSYHKGEHQLLITPAGHIFDCDKSDKTVNEVIEKSVEFIFSQNVKD